MQDGGSRFRCLDILRGGSGAEAHTSSNPPGVNWKPLATRCPSVQAIIDNMGGIEPQLAVSCRQGTILSSLKDPRAGQQLTPLWGTSMVMRLCHNSDCTPHTSCILMCHRIFFAASA